MRDLGRLQNRLAGAAILIAVTFAVGVVGYRIIGGHQSTWMDAIYMTANVLTTAGFREAIDLKDNQVGQAFTVVLLLFGAGVIVYSTSVITAFVVEGDLTEGFRRRRMRRTIDHMSGHSIVCGAGGTGFAVVRELVNTQRSVVVIETDADRSHRIETDFPMVPVIKGDFTDDQILIQAGISRASGVVICTTIDKDLLVTTITARQLNPRLRIVARAANERSLARLRQAGADAVVSPAMIGGMRMASELVRPSVVTFLDTMLRDTNRNLRIEEVTVPNGSPLVGKTLGDLNTHTRTNTLLLAVRLANGTYHYNPPDSERIDAFIVLIVMGDPGDVHRLQVVCDGGNPDAMTSPSTASSTAAV